MNPLIAVLLMLLFPLVGTAWGWRNVLLPVFKWTLPKLFTSVMVLIWVGFFTAMASSGWFYRAFGFGTTDLVGALTRSEALAQRTLIDREESYDLDGNYAPGWRQKRGLPRLEHWQGPEHSVLPRAALPLLALLCVGIWVHRRRARALEQQRQALSRGYYEVFR